MILRPIREASILLMDLTMRTCCGIYIIIPGKDVVFNEKVDSELFNNALETVKSVKLTPPINIIPSVMPIIVSTK